MKNMKVNIKGFEKSIIKANKLDVLILALNTITSNNIIAIKIIISENDLKEIKENSKHLILGDNNSFFLQGIYVCSSENIRDGNFIIVTETSLMLEDKFLKVINKINKK